MKALRMGIIYHTFHALTPNNLHLLYASLIRPIFDYTCVVWQPYLLKDIRTLEAVQRRATRLLPNLAHLTYTDRLEVIEFALTIIPKVKDGHDFDI